MAQDINIKVNVDTTSAQAQTTDYDKRLKELTDEMVKLNIETEGLSKATAEQKKRFNELAQEAGNIKDAMGDAQTQVNNLSDDYSTLNTAIQGLQGAVGAISAVSGAMSVLGVDSEEATQSIKTLTGLMSVMQGLENAQKALNKDSLVMKALQTAKNKLLTQSIKEQTKAQVALNVAKLGAVAVIAGVVTALGVLVAKYASAKNAAADLTKELNKQATDTIAKNVSELGRLKEGWSELGGDLEKQTKFLEENKAALEGMGLAFNDVNEAEEFFQNQTENYVKAITARAKAEAVRAMIVEETKKQLEAEMEAERVASGELTFWEDAAIKMGQVNQETLVAVAQNEVDATQKSIDKLKEKAKAYEEEAKAAEVSVDAMKKVSEEVKKVEPKKAEYAEQQKKAREERIALTEKELGEIDKFIAEQEKAHSTTLQNIDEEEVAITEMYDKALDNAIKYYGEDSLQVKRITALRIKALDDVDKKREEYFDKQAKEEEDARKKADEDALKAARDAEDAQKRIEKAKLDAQLLALEENSAEYYEKKAEIDRQAEATELLALERLLWDKQITQEEYESQYDLLVANHAKNRADLEIAEAQRAKDEIDQIEQKKWQFAEDLVKNYQNIISAAMEAELEAVGDNEEEQKKVRKKYAKAQFVGQIASIGISTAQAIMGAWASASSIPYPANLIIGGIMTALLAGTGIAQSVKARNEMNTAMRAERGGILVGASHAQGGIMLSNGVEAEGGEAIINKRSTEAFAPLLSEINAYNGYGAPLISAQPTSSSSSSSLSSDSAIRKIVQETIAGVTAIPVVVSEHSITEAQRQVGITRERAFI